MQPAPKAPANMEDIMASKTTLYLTSALAACFAVSSPAFAAVNISSAPTKNVACSAGVCTPTAKGAILNAADLQNLLATSDVTVNTGSGAVTIEITAPLAWASTHRLTLNASFNVSVKAVVAVEGTAGLTVNYSNGGDLLFFPGGKIDFWDTNSSLIVNGTSHVLVNDIATLASDVAANQSGLYAFAKDYDAGPDGTYQNGITNFGFAGELEGLGHTVSNLSIQGGAVTAVGMFQQTVSGVVIRDLSLENVNIQASGGSVGAFVGQGGANFVDVSSSGSISGGTDVGGLIGQLTNGGNVTRSHSSATVDGGSAETAGGLAGRASGAILYSYDVGRVSGGPKSLVGGLAGTLAGNVVQSYSTAAVDSHGSVNIGGLLGALSQDSTVTDSYAMGQVTAGHFSRIGGLVGTSSAGTVSTSYSTASVIYRSHAPVQPRVGGFIGKSVHGRNRADYWDLDTSGQSSACDRNCGDVTGLSDAALRSGLPGGFDAAVWGQSASVNDGYPYLIANPPQ